MTLNIRIEPARGWFRLGLRELWAYRELLFFFVWRDIKVRYKQTLFGASWAVLQPVLLMVVFTIFLHQLARVSSGDTPYPIFVFTALIPWTLFAQALLGASESLVTSSNLVTKVYFPRLLLPIAVAGSYLLDFAIAMVVLVGMMVYYGLYPSSSVIWLPVFAVLAFATALAIGIWLAALNVRYRDVRYAVPFLIQLWLFASPVAYPVSVVPKAYRALYGLNPMAGVIEGFRWSLLGSGERPDVLVLVSSLVTLVVAVAGIGYFRRVESTFADVI